MEEVLNKKKKLKKLDIGNYGPMMDQGSSMKASVPTTTDYGVNVKVFCKTRLKLCVTL